MFNLSEVKASVSRPVKKQENNPEAFLQEAHELFARFRQDHEISTLRQSMEKFAEVIKFQRNNPESYFFLAAGFYMIDKKDTALEYLEIVKSLQPDYPGLEKFFNLIYTGGN